MAKEKTVYQCQACGFESPKWLGKCPDCGQWNTLVEEHLAPKRFSRATAHPEPLSSIPHEVGGRLSTKIAELDRVLGGGIVRGSAVLVGGDPGIGKSTLLLQAAAKFDLPVLYVSAEESPEQIKMRAERLGIRSEKIGVLSETLLENIIAEAKRSRPELLIIDSIQTIYTDEMNSAPGSVGQVRDCAARLVQFAKQNGVSVFIVGHVTKEGMIAGPRVLEHIVDTVFYFEGQKGHSFRILRTVKNRFGSTNEIGVFEMTDAGLSEVENPSELFLAERPVNVSGSVVAASIEGTRPLLVEIQALVSTSTFSVPRRASLGMDLQRVNLILAVLEKVSGLHLAGMDVFLNIVGGLRIDEPAIDLAVAAAVVSSLRNRPISPQAFLFGEIGLSGEIRAVSHADARLKEAAKIGLKEAVIPALNREKLKAINGLAITGAKDINQALDALGI